jgi:cytidylate kinase
LTPQQTRKVKKQKTVVICVCGMTASGKSTVARRLAEKYHLRLYSGGDALKTLAREAGHRPTDRGWWESKEGLKFLQQRLHDPDFDKKVDKKLLEVAKDGNVVLDSWTMPWLFDGGFKIWIEASKKIRIRRLAERDGLSLRKASEVLEEKEESTKTIYRRLYGFHLGEDFSPFDLILDTDKLNAEEVFQAVSLVVDRVLLKKPTLENQ